MTCFDPGSLRSTAALKTYEGAAVIKALHHLREAFAFIA
jgi:hypothetical protein